MVPSTSASFLVLLSLLCVLLEEGAKIIHPFKPWRWWGIHGQAENRFTPLNRGEGARFKLWVLWSHISSRTMKIRPIPP